MGDESRDGDSMADALREVNLKILVMDELGEASDTISFACSPIVSPYHVEG